MEWLEQNIDAYRIVAEILSDLRETLRKGLEEIYGKQWYKTGLPDGVLDRLVEAKEREQAIDWYDSEYQQVVDYAVFPDLLEILEYNSESFPEIMRLAPSPAVLHARFLELEVMRAKLGRTRPINETELSFLGTFHLRFRKAMAEAREAEASEARPRPKPHHVHDEEGGTEEAATANQAADDGNGNEEVAAVEPPKPEDKPDTKPRPPQRPVQTLSPPKPKVDESAAEKEASPEPEIEVKIDEEPGFEGGPRRLAKALKGNDHQAVLRELYREVTAIAEGLWSSDVIPAPLVWEQVIASDWYEVNFSRLGLQPLSDFYDVINKVEKMSGKGEMSDGALQDFLKDSNFAKILLSLRDMFQKNKI